MLKFTEVQFLQRVYFYRLPSRLRLIQSVKTVYVFKLVIVFH